MGRICNSALSEPEIVAVLGQDRPVDRGAGENPEPSEPHCVDFIIFYPKKKEPAEK